MLQVATVTTDWFDDWILDPRPLTFWEYAEEREEFESRRREHTAAQEMFAAHFQGGMAAMQQRQAGLAALQQQAVVLWCDRCAVSFPMNSIHTHIHRLGGPLGGLGHPLGGLLGGLFGILGQGGMKRWE